MGHLAGVLLTIGGAGQIARVSRWRPFGASEPLIWMLHIGFAWVPLAMLLTAAGIFRPETFSQSVSFHTFGAGAIAGMTLIVMMRALLGHSKIPIVADKLSIGAFTLIASGALIRIIAALHDALIPLLDIAATLWTLGFLLFPIRFVPIALSKPKP